VETLSTDSELPDTEVKEIDESLGPDNTKAIGRSLQRTANPRPESDIYVIGEEIRIVNL